MKEAKPFKNETELSTIYLILQNKRVYVCERESVRGLLLFSTVCRRTVIEYNNM